MSRQASKECCWRQLARPATERAISGWFYAPSDATVSSSHERRTHSSADTGFCGLILLLLLLLSKGGHVL